MGSCLLEKAQVLHGGQGREPPSFMGSLSRKKRLGLSASQSFGLRWQVLGGSCDSGCSSVQGPGGWCVGSQSRGLGGPGETGGPPVPSPALLLCFPFPLASAPPSANSTENSSSLSFHALDSGQMRQDSGSHLLPMCMASGRALTHLLAPQPPSYVKWY